MLSDIRACALFGVWVEAPCQGAALHSDGACDFWSWRAGQEHLVCCWVMCMSQPERATGTQGNIYGYLVVCLKGLERLRTHS